MVAASKVKFVPFIDHTVFCLSCAGERFSIVLQELVTRKFPRVLTECNLHNARSNVRFWTKAFRLTTIEWGTPTIKCDLQFSRLRFPKMDNYLFSGVIFHWDGGHFGKIITFNLIALHFELCDRNDKRGAYIQEE